MNCLVGVLLMEAAAINVVRSSAAPSKPMICLGRSSLLASNGPAFVCFVSSFPLSSKMEMVSKQYHEAWGYHCVLMLSRGRWKKMKMMFDEIRKEYIVALLSLVCNVEKAIQMHDDLSLSTLNPVELLMGCFNSIKGIKERR